ncbi:MAG TPA: Ig-like domain-containing protein [Anaerolineales bacterium]|nr:Ig-like domain-containing protein [Anaerolineales bacterium]
MKSKLFSLLAIFIVCIPLILPRHASLAAPEPSSLSLENVPLSLPAGWSSGRLTGVWGSGANDVYVVGFAEDNSGHATPLLYHNDGTSWSEASPSLPLGWRIGKLYAVWGSSASDVYLVGEGYGMNGYDIPLLYHYTGSGWIQTALSLPMDWSGGHLTSVWGSSASDVYAVGWGQGITPLLYHNDGTGWSEASASVPYEAGALQGIWGSGANDVYTGGHSLGLPYLYHNDGTGWAPIVLPSSGVQLYGVSGSSAHDVFAVGYSLDLSGNAIPRIYQKEGSAWSEVTPTLTAGWSNAQLAGVWGSSAANIYAAGEAHNRIGAIPLLYHNDGTGWTEVGPSVPAGWSFSHLLGVWGPDADGVYAVGFGVDTTGHAMPLLYESHIADVTAPTITSILRANTDPTNVSSVEFIVTFSEPVTGVDTTAPFEDFRLTTSGIAAAEILGVMGSNDIYTVTVNRGLGDGTLRLDLVDDDSIQDSSHIPLGSSGRGNGGFNTGEYYTIQEPAANISGPLLSLPRNNYLTNDSTPSLSWSPVGTAIKYEIQFASDSAFTQHVDSYSAGDSSFTLNTPLADGKYYWWVRAYNAAGEHGAWSPVRSFTIDTSLPAAPVLRFPADNASVRGVPTFRWSSVSGAVSYQFEIDDDSDFSSPVLSVTQRTLYRRPSGALRGTYFWHVKAQDAAGNWSDWSQLFTVNISALR